MCRYVDMYFVYSLSDFSKRMANKFAVGMVNYDLMLYTGKRESVNNMLFTNDYMISLSVKKK